MFDVNPGHDWSVSSLLYSSFGRLGAIAYVLRVRAPDKPSPAVDHVAWGKPGFDEVENRIDSQDEEVNGFAVHPPE